MVELFPKDLQSQYIPDRQYGVQYFMFRKRIRRLIDEEGGGIFYDKHPIFGRSPGIVIKNPDDEQPEEEVNEESWYFIG